MRRIGRRLTYLGVTYYASRESLARDGGDPPRDWYWVVEDPKLGACIDERVPEEHYETLRSAYVALYRHLGLVTKDTITNAQIVALRDDPSTNVAIRRVCKIALDEGVVHARAREIELARERVAHYLNHIKEASA